MRQGYLLVTLFISCRNISLRNEEFRAQAIYFYFFSSQGEKGPGGLPGHPGEEGEHVSTKSHFSL